MATIHAQDDTYAEKVIDSIFQAISKMDSVQDQISELESQANYFHDFAPWTKVFLDSALILAQEAKMDKEIAIAIFNQLQFYVFNTQFDSALVQYDKGIVMNVVQQNNGLQSDFAAMLGTMYKKQGNVKVSIKHFAKALALMEEPGYLESLENEDEKVESQRSLVIINNNLANLYQDIEDYEAAHAAYQDAYDLLIGMDEKAIAGTVWMNKGSIFLKQEKFDSAYLIQSEALQLKEKGGASQRALAMSYLNVGNALLGSKKLDEATVQFERALSTFQEIENKVGLANTYVDLGRLHLEKKDFDRARMNCLQGKGIARQVNQLDLQANACECLHQAYRSLGNYASALQNHEELKLLHDSLRNDENTRYITQLEMQYDFDREEERRLVQQEAEALLQEARDQRTRRILLLLSILLVSAILLAYLWYRNYRIKKQSAAELAEKNLMVSRALDENKLLLKEIHHRVKNNLQVISSLLRLQSRYIEDNAALDAIASGRNRVQSMALLHENLYQEDNLQGVDMQTYFDKLIDGIFETVNTGQQNIQLQKDIAPITLDIDSVVPLGLITNELITNALKHAFKDREEGLLRVALFERKDDLFLVVEDDGKGMSEDFFTSKSTSFGHKLIQAFVRNLRAEIKVNSEKGTRIELIVRKYQKAS
ncbi:MAG: tetratricopeptide repeat protein [Saprospiraceae bacterium]|nr:tetratricopeptide repeat protein [Saprospiraceae bacterium]